MNEINTGSPLSNPSRYLLQHWHLLQLHQFVLTFPMRRRNRMLMFISRRHVFPHVRCPGRTEISRWRTRIWGSLRWWFFVQHRLSVWFQLSRRRSVRLRGACRLCEETRKWKPRTERYTRILSRALLLETRDVWCGPVLNGLEPFVSVIDYGLRIYESLRKCL